MSSSTKAMFQRPTLDQITEIPNEIISVYVVENHIWARSGTNDAKKERQAEKRTVSEFLIDPVRPFLNDIFRQIARPYDITRRDDPIGQGYWIQAEFGSGKSHLLSFIGALALGNANEWDIIRQKENEAGLGRRESLYNFYENGLERKNNETKGILVAVKTLVGQGGGGIGVDDNNRTLAHYVLDAVAEQFFAETGKSLPLYPTQILAERFLQTGDFERYRRDLALFLKDPNYFDEEEQEEIDDFLDDLQNNQDPAVQRDCGDRLWTFYKQYLRIQPEIPLEVEPLLEHMMHRILDEGYAGLLLILDEVSLYMKGRNDTQRVEDEKALVVLSNRLAKVKNLPIWTVCAAQQAIETKMAGVKNIIARERLDLVPLLNKQDYYYDIALSRVRKIINDKAIDQYYEDYKRSFSWPASVGKDKFAHFFPFYPPSIDVVRAVSYNLTTVRSALYFMLQTLKTQRKKKSQELITLWSLFDDVVDYEEDPSGTTKGIASIKTKWPDEWKAYENSKHQLDTVTKGPLKVYRSRSEKIVKTLFLYRIVEMDGMGLSPEDLMNGVMEWKDHEAQDTDLQDNLDHYEILADKLALELAQVVKLGHNFQFNTTGSATDPREHFEKARAEAVQNEVLRNQAWEALLSLNGWQVTTSLMTLDLSFGIKSVFRDIAPSSQNQITVKWHGREITGRVYMRDLLHEARRRGMLPSINSAETKEDFAVFISSRSATDVIDELIKMKNDGRILFWSPGEFTPAELELLIDFAAYRQLVSEFSARDTQEGKEVIDWVQNKLRDQIGTIYRIVPDSFSRGRIASLDHSDMRFTTQGELRAVLEPLVGQALDTVYISRELEFGFQAPFNDVSAVNVINGVVKLREIPRGARPTKEIDASKNYGFDLQIMKRPNDRLLDISDCRYTTDMLTWIEDKLAGGNTNMPVRTLYKNFMGSGGPNDTDYGLSQRMVQLYLLCLVREGKLRISLSGRNLPVDFIDYSNIAEIDFRVAILDSFDEVQRLKPPEGWELLAPFAAILLEDEDLRTARQDADIQEGVARVIEYRKAQRGNISALREGMTQLFQEIEQDNPVEQVLNQWEKFLLAEVKSNDPIPFLLNALDESFDYRVYHDDRVEQSEIDDFKTRFIEIGQINKFYEYRDQIRAAARYTKYEMPDIPELANVSATMRRVKTLMSHLDDLIHNEARLMSDLIDPIKDAIGSYSVRYLQAFDQVTARAEEVRQEIDGLQNDATFVSLARLAQVRQLGEDVTHGLQNFFETQLVELENTFPPTLTRVTIERELHDEPEPPRSPVNLINAKDASRWIEELIAASRNRLTDALRDKASLLNSEVLRQRLEQGRGETFIARLLDTSVVEDMMQVLIDALGSNQSQNPDPIELLERFLRTLNVRRLRLADFQPTKTTLEPADIDVIVDEFRDFLSDALRTDDDDELPVVELE